MIGMLHALLAAFAMQGTFRTAPSVRLPSMLVGGMEAG